MSDLRNPQMTDGLHDSSEPDTDLVMTEVMLVEAIRTNRYNYSKQEEAIKAFFTEYYELYLFADMWTMEDLMTECISDFDLVLSSLRLKFACQKPKDFEQSSWHLILHQNLALQFIDKIYTDTYIPMGELEEDSLHDTFIKHLTEGTSHIDQEILKDLFERHPEFAWHWSSALLKLAQMSEEEAFLRRAPQEAAL